MKTSLPCTGELRFVSVRAPQTRPNAIVNKDGSIIHVYNTEVIRMVSRAFRASYEVVVPPDGQFGQPLPNGTWTGMIGMLRRSEADIASAGVTLTEERNGAVHFSYPYMQSALGFMTDKPEPISTNLAVFYPFSLLIWALILGSVVVMSILFYLLLGRKVTYQSILLNTFGSLLENSLDFPMKKRILKGLVIAWFLSVMVITNSYKGILLSFLSFPTMVGVRTISDLSREAAKSSFTCVTFPGSYVTQILLDSTDESWNAIGACLRRNEPMSPSIMDTFRNIPPKKAFVGTKSIMPSYEREYYITKDAFYHDLYAFPYSKDLCCPRCLDRAILRMDAAGLMEKFLTDQHFFFRIALPPVPTVQIDIPSKIYLDDVSGAFYILICGWVLGGVALLGEIIKKRYSSG